MTPAALVASATPPRWQRIARALTPVMLLAFVAVIALPTYQYQAYRGMLEARTQAAHRLDLLASAVDSIIMRLEHIPATVELNPDVRALLNATASEDLRPRVNRYLEDLKREIGAEAVYVLNEHGIVVAASNAGSAGSFVGEDFSYRTYFRWALGGLTGRHFAVGSTRGEPGYFVARPVRHDGMPIGVTTVKIGLKELSDALATLDAPTLIADSNGVVIMSPREDWLYRALQPMPAEALAEVAQSRRYNDRRIEAFPVPIDFRAVDPMPTVRLPVIFQDALTGQDDRRDAEHVVLVRPLERTGWWLVQFADLADVRKQARDGAVLAVAAASALLMLLVIFSQRRRIVRQKLESQSMLERANAELEKTVALRTQDLSATNARLRDEMAEREAAERTLREAQDELVQAAKLAVLGQLATGITHELTQPLGAIRTLSGNAAEFLRRGAPDKAGKNLEIVNRLADQMGAIIAQLKTFARKSPARPADVSLASAVRNALQMVEHKLKKRAVTVLTDVPESARVHCDPIRLEQVLVNLYSNAADALAGRQGGQLRTTVEGAPERPSALLVSDNGPGLPPEVVEHLFEPFFTTKPPGEGLGLGLVISRDIIREAGGDLLAENGPQGGACFRIALPQHCEGTTHV